MTTQSLTYDTLKALSVAVGKDRTLMVCCKAFRSKLTDFPNISVKKIPQAVLENCEWGRDDYSLNISKPPEDAIAEPDDEPETDGGNGDEPTPKRRGRPRRAAEPEVQAAPVKKAPLKMDGTTRALRSPKTAVPAAGPASKPAAPAAMARKTVAKAKASTASSKPKAKTILPAPKTDERKAPAKTKGRGAAGDAQGKLL